MITREFKLFVALGLAFWTFVGVEGVTPLAEETKSASGALARGMTWSLVIVLATSIAMGIGIAGASPLSEWSRLLASTEACEGECPHIAVGYAMLGAGGRTLMALSAVAACFGTVMIGLTGVARLVYALSRDALPIGRLSSWLGRTTANGRPPNAALIASAVLLAIPPLFAQQVIAWLLPAALVWMLLYVGYHVLVLLDRYFVPQRPRPWRMPTTLAAVGAVATTAAVPFVFHEVEVLGLVGRAASVLVGAAAITLALGVREARLDGTSRATEL